MPKKETRPSKDLYRELRLVPWLRLWQEEVPRYLASSPEEKIQRVALIRAIGAGSAAARERVVPASPEQVVDLGVADQHIVA